MVLVASTALPLVAQAPGQHPNPRFIDQSIAPVVRLRQNGPAMPAPFAIPARPEVSIGSEEDPDSLLIGEITGAAINSRGQILMLDAKSNLVRVYGGNGKPIGRVGRYGHGPGELSNPQGIAVGPDDRLYIANLERNLQVYRMTPQGYAFERQIVLGVSTNSLCVMGEKLVVQGMPFGDNRAIRVFDLEGRSVASFGKIYTSSHELSNYMFSEGRIVCDPTAGLIFYAPESVLGEVRAYQLDGTPAWRVTIEPYLTNVIEENEGGGHTVSGSADGIHRLTGLTLIPGHGLAVQIGYLTLADNVAGASYTTLETFLLDPRTGRGESIGTRIPPLAAASGRRVLSSLEDPVPQLNVLEVRPQP
jgi:hypothetical protein